MKKIIIVNNNMKVGGVQKSLYNLLWNIKDRYDITLCLFRRIGAYADQLPPEVKVIECDSLFRFLGMGQEECSGAEALKRGALAAICRGLGRPAVMKPLLASQKTLPGEYDCAISFLQNGRNSNFYGGVQEFVLRRIRAKKKVAFLHCDYGRCGAKGPHNDRLLMGFDRIAACSEGCRSALIQALPECDSKSVTVRNCHRIDQIWAMAQEAPVVYESGAVHLVTVSRLSHEKGIERALEAVACVIGRGLPVRLHIVGGGPMEPMLRQRVQELGIGGYVEFLGEQGNPYRFMVNADLFLLTSYHEAAPMVIEEAACLGVPVLTTRTTSSREMVTDRDCGWVCDNDQQALNQELTRILEQEGLLSAKKKMLLGNVTDNREALEQFITLIEG